VKRVDQSASSLHGRIVEGFSEVVCSLVHTSGLAPRRKVTSNTKCDLPELRVASQFGMAVCVQPGGMMGGAGHVFTSAHISIVVWRPKNGEARQRLEIALAEGPIWRAWTMNRLGAGPT